MKIKKIISMILCVLSVASLFSGCQAAPESSVVAGKNDGAFESALESEASEEVQKESFSYKEKFTSADGKIEFNVDVSNIEYGSDSMPVIQVTPKTFTEENAKQIANVLFGDAKLYEYSEELSKKELEEQILYYRRISTYQYIEQEEYKDFTGSREELESIIQGHIEARLAILKELEEKYKTAKDDIERQECRWTFYPISHYFLLGSIYDENDNKTKEIKAVTEIDGIPYMYWVSNRDADDYRNHSISAFCYDRKMDAVEEKNMWKKLCSTKKPSEEEVENVRRQAEDIITRMGIGKWEITYCEAVYNEYGSGYQIAIEAAPVYNDIIVTPLPQLGNLKSQNEYASNYYYEKLEMVLSVEGQIISFEYRGPLEVVDVINENTPVISYDKLKERIKTQLSLDDIGMYQTNGNSSTEKVVMMISKMEFGLSRVKIKDNPRDFYLVPAVTLQGAYIMYNSGGEAVGTNPAQGISTMLVLNLVDGSVIHYQQ